MVGKHHFFPKMYCDYCIFEMHFKNTKIKKRLDAVYEKPFFPVQFRQSCRYEMLQNSYFGYMYGNHCSLGSWIQKSKIKLFKVIFKLFFQSSTGSSSGVRQPLRYGQSGIRPPSASTSSRIARPTTGIPRPGATSRLPAPSSASSGIPKPGGSNPGSRASSATGRKTSYCYWETLKKMK